MKAAGNTYRYIRWFGELCLRDVPLVGGKNASLGEMYRELGIPSIVGTGDATVKVASETEITVCCAEGIGTIAAAFHPRPVVVRLSDFKTNEYASLLGGKAFEPVEENPMIGFRGASRYYDERYREGFALECRALRRVRDVMGLRNVIPMIPFCRTVGEGEKVLAEMAKNGLVRGAGGLKVYVMCEIPNNVILIDAFSRLFDGFSIGSNDLTQLTLGVDRDSALVAHVFDERDPGVMALISRVIEGGRRNRVHSGICGQAPSDYPDFAAFLVREGIDSISLNPDSVLKITLRVLEMEKELVEAL